MTKPTPDRRAGASRARIRASASRAGVESAASRDEAARQAEAAAQAEAAGQPQPAGGGVQDGEEGAEAAAEAGVQSRAGSPPHARSSYRVASQDRLPGWGEELLTPAEVASLFKVDPKTVVRWTKAGYLDAVTTPGGHRRFRESEVRALLGSGQELPAEGGGGTAA